MAEMRNRPVPAQNSFRFPSRTGCKGDISGIIRLNRHVGIERRIMTSKDRCQKTASIWNRDLAAEILRLVKELP